MNSAAADQIASDRSLTRQIVQAFNLQACVLDYDRLFQMFERVFYLLANYEMLVALVLGNILFHRVDLVEEERFPSWINRNSAEIKADCHPKISPQ